MAPLGPPTAYDVDRIRWHFPALHEGAAHFDGPGGSQVPDTVATAVVETLTSAISNRGTVTAAERRADRVVVEARAAMGDLLAVDPGGVVFGRSATELTFQLARTLSSDWGPGDEVVVSRLDHDANIRPWVLAAEARGASVRWAEFDPGTGELSPDAVGAVVGERTRLVAVTAASNLIGTRPDLPAIAEIAHAAGALLWVDGVHATAHVLTDVPASGARDAAPRQAAALVRRRARAVRARHAALRAARRHDGRRRLPRRPRPHRPLSAPPSTTRLLLRRARGPRGRPPRHAGGAAARRPGAHGTQQRAAPDPDAARHRGGPRSAGPARRPRRTRRQRAGRALLRVGGQPRARARRHRGAADGPRSLHQRRRRRPARVRHRPA